MHDLAPGDPAAADTETQEWLRELCRRADEILWDSYRFAMEVPGAPWPRVLFPQKGQVRRVGAQEARLAFVAAILGESDPDPWAFAAEVPTRLSYRFAPRGAGEKAQKALTDLALYRHGHDEPALVVEFESGGRSGRSEIDENIPRDVAKILAERPDALWFHVVRSATSETLEGLLRSLDEAISRLSSPNRLSDYLAAGKTVEPRAKKIAFHICVLNPGVTASIHGVLDYVPGKPKRDFFALDVVATRDSLEVAEELGWRVFRGSTR